MNVSNPYGCLAAYRPGYGYTGYINSIMAKQRSKNQFQEMMEQHVTKKWEPSHVFAPGIYDPNDTFERRELTKDELDELAGRLAQKYDPRNMTQEEYDSFLDDLVAESILSVNQLGQLAYHGSVCLGGGWVIGSYMRSEDIMTHHNNPYYQLYGYASSLGDTRGDALAYASLMSLQHYWSGNAAFQNYAEKRQSNYEAMTQVLEAMQRQRQR